MFCAKHRVFAYFPNIMFSDKSLQFDDGEQRIYNATSKSNLLNLQYFSES